MLYKFKSRSTADLIMLEPDGKRLLQLIGKDPGPRGIVTAEQIPAAVQALEAAVLDEERRFGEGGQPANADAADEMEPDDKDRDPVGLRQRAAPFIDMLRRSAAEGSDVVWGA